MNTKNRIVCLIVYAAAVLPCFGADKVARFSKLPADERFVIRFISSGCFHFHASEFTFYPTSNGRLDVDELHMEWSEAKKERVVRSRKHIGSVRLEHGEVKKLDALVTFYRSGFTPEIFLNSSDSIHLVQMRGRLIVAEESVIDRSPSMTDSKPELITFGQMLHAVVLVSK